MNADERRSFTVKIFFIFLIFSFLFCSKANTPEGAAELVVKLAQNGEFEKIKKQCTSKTVKAIDELLEYSDLYDWRFILKRKYADGSDWIIIGKEISDGVASIRLKCVSHPIENTRGNESIIRLQQTGKQWQLDMAAELQKALESARQYKKNFGAGQDLRRFIR